MLFRYRLRPLSLCVSCARVVSRNRYHADAVPGSCNETREKKTPRQKRTFDGTTTTKTGIKRKKYVALPYRWSHLVLSQSYIQLAERVLYSNALTNSPAQSHHRRLGTRPLSLKIPRTSALLVCTPQTRSMGSAIAIQSRPLTSYISSTTRTSHGEYIGKLVSW